MIKNKLKVSHILYSNLGGASNVVFSLVDHNKHKFYEENLIFTGPNFLKDFKEKVKSVNVKYKFIKTFKFFQFLSWLHLVRHLIHQRPDIIFVHNYQIIPVIIYKLFFSNKIIYVDHWNAVTQKLKKKIIAIFVKFFFERIIVLNNDNYNFYKKNININTKKILLIPNGININFFKSKKYKKKSRIFKIGMATRLDGIEKLPELIVDALKMIEPDKLKINFNIAGDGKRKKLFENKIKELNLENHCFMNGYLSQSELKKWYNELDLYIHATLGEAMSISILQAMSMKIPILASNVSGVNNLIGAKKNLGMLFENNKFDLAKKIKIFYFMSLKEKKKFSNTQKNFVDKNFSDKSMFNRYKKLILNLKL